MIRPGFPIAVALGFLCACTGATCVAQSTAQRQPASERADMPELHWRMIGPFRGGRTRAATGVSDQPNVFYIGQVDGGVWKSDDYGRTWRPIFDAENTQSIGAIAVAPSDHNVIYVGSGEGLHRPDLSVGDGMYRSADAGQTWTHLGLRDGQQIPAIAIDPKNPDRLFAAVLGHPYGPNPQRGIFRSTDGGQTWKKVLYRNDDVGGSDVVIDPSDPNVIYASMWQSTLGPWEDDNSYEGTGGGLFKSTDGGDTWHRLSKGLPADLVQINIALAPSETHRLYATVSTMTESAYASANGLGVFRSDDAGESWTRITDDPRPAMKIGGGDLPVPRVDPQNADVVYSASIVTCRSNDGGKTWISLRGAPGGDDYQNLWINPRNPKIILLVSDQGALVSVNGGDSWSSWYNQPTAQLYHVAATNTFPYQVCGGQQESGSVCTSTRGNDGEITFRDWHPAGIIEYGYAAPDPLHPNVVYGAGRTEVSRYDATTGQVQNVTPLPVKDSASRADRTEPVLFSPVDPHLLYYAANKLFVTNDGGQTWRTISPDLTQERTGQPASLPPLTAKQQSKRRGAIYAVAASFRSTQTIWVGTDDGLLWRTRDGGMHWNNITPGDVTPWSKISQIDVSRFDDETAYVSASRMRLDDQRPYIYRTHDGGKTWQAIASTLPGGSPVNAVRADPERRGLLYAATETAVWFSLDDGDHWQPLQYNLPHTSMRDLLVHGDDLVVATHGRSFWVLDGIGPLRQLAASATIREPFVFTPALTYRLRRDTNTDTPLPADEPAGENPPDGAIIDYALPAGITGPVHLEILNAHGLVVRHYSSTDSITPTPAELSRQLIPRNWPLVERPLSARAGMHRLVWDLHYSAPAAIRYEYPISAVPHRTPRVPQGPLALPGKYTVKLIAGGRSATAPLAIAMDPRVHISAQDLSKLFQAQEQMAHSLSLISKATLEAHAVEQQIAGPGKNLRQDAALHSAIERFQTKLNALMQSPAAEEQNAPSGLDALAEAAIPLYTQLGQADAAPTAAQWKVEAEIQQQITHAVGAWEQFKRADIPALDQRLRGVHLAPLDPTREPTELPGGGDED